MMISSSLSFSRKSKRLYHFSFIFCESDSSSRHETVCKLIHKTHISPLCSSVYNNMLKTNISPLHDKLMLFVTRPSPDLIANHIKRPLQTYWINFYSLSSILPFHVSLRIVYRIEINSKTMPTLKLLGQTTTTTEWVGYDKAKFASKT